MTIETEQKRPQQILNSLALAGYRSFGIEPQFFPQLSKINILIGQNNCGKSNVLRFIHDWFARLEEYQKPRLNDHDRHLPNGGGGLRYGLLPICFYDGKIDPEALSTQYKVANGAQQQLVLSTLLAAVSAAGDNSNEPWFFFGEDGKFQPPNLKAAFNKIQDHTLQNLWSHLTKRNGGSRDQHWEPETLGTLVPPIPSFKCHLIPAIRKIGIKGSTSEEFSGEGIIERLAKLQNPPAMAQQEKERFKKIGDFLRTVTDNDSAEIEIPYERDTILVRMDGKTLPLESLGSGIHEVIILAAAATILDECVICMEEPELHLNPILQKKLVRYLQGATTNQYFITSHSAALMDTPDAEVYHITLRAGSSLIERVTSDKQRSAVCEDLGYHPSDLLQTNCVIWVEGPSDRIYLNWWIQAIDLELIEGIHYSIMFYGGRLASHLSGEDAGTFVEDFISLRRLNRRGVILIDSDKPKKGAKLNATKIRLRDEFDQGPGHAWITSGREIENYIEQSLLKKCIEGVHPSMTVTTDLGQYDNSLSVQNRKGDKIQANKVKVASQVVHAAQPDWGRFDLNVQAKKLVAFIRASNPSVHITKR